MDISVKYEIPKNSLKIDRKTFTKITFIYNAINHGWTVSKKNDKYIFTRPHDGRKEIFTDSYLNTFVKSNLDLNLFN